MILPEYPMIELILSFLLIPVCKLIMQPWLKPPIATFSLVRLLFFITSSIKVFNFISAIKEFARTWSLVWSIKLNH